MPSRAATHRRTESSARPIPPSGDYRGEQLTLRNHDARGGYGLSIRVTDASGHRERSHFFVGSNTTKRVFDLCEPGEVTVEVFHAGEPAATVTTTVDDKTAGTVVVECTHGVVEATTGPTQ